MSKSLNVKAWAVDTAIRAIKTAAQTAVAALGVNATGLLHVDWVAVGSLSGLAAVTCVLQNLSNLDVASVESSVDPAPAVAVVPAPEAPAPSA
ncbi:MAG: holin [Mycobacteriaceae bacterium]